MSEILKTVVSLSLSASLVAAVLLLLSPLYRQRLHKTWQYYIWLIVVVRLLVPFAPTANLMGQLTQRAEIRTSAPVQREIVMRDDAQHTPVEDDPVLPGAVEAAESAPIAEFYAGTATATPLAELRDNLWLVWLGVAVVLLVRKITSYHSFTRFIRAGRQEVEDPAILDAFFTACEQQGIHRPLPLYTNKLAVSPMLVGILRPWIVLPEVRMDEEELLLVFRHELIHYKRQDILYKWLVQIAVCLHWFNPLIYLVSREINKACELSCDEMVLRRLDTDHKRHYGNALMAAVTGGGSYGDTVASVTLSEDAKLLKERLEAIIRHGKKPKVVAAGSLILAMLLFCGAAFAGAYTGTRSVIQSAAAENPEPVAAVTSSLPETWVEESSRTSNWGTVTKTESFTMIQRYLYQDNYIFGVRWQRNIDPALYPAAIQLTVGSREYAFAFEKEAQDYADDAAFLSALQNGAAEFIRTGGGNDWSESVFVVLEVYGPYTEPADELVKQFYSGDDLTKFSAVIGSATAETALEMLGYAYQDNQVSYFSILINYLPKDANLDHIVGQAYAPERISMLYQMIDYLSTDARQELLEQAVSSNNVSLVSLLIDDIPGLDADRMAEEALRNNNASLFSILLDHVSGTKKAELAAEAVRNNQVSIFSMLTDELNSANTAQMAADALRNNQTSILSILVPYLSQAEADQLGEAAYDQNQISAFSMLVNYMSSAKLSELAKRSFDEQKYSYQSLLMGYLS